MTWSFHEITSNGRETGPWVFWGNVILLAHLGFFICLEWLAVSVRIRLLGCLRICQCVWMMSVSIWLVFAYMYLSVSLHCMCARLYPVDGSIAMLSMCVCPLVSMWISSSHSVWMCACLSLSVCYYNFVCLRACVSVYYPCVCLSFSVCFQRDQCFPASVHVCMSAYLSKYLCVSVSMSLRFLLPTSNDSHSIFLSLSLNQALSFQPLVI